MGGDKEKLVIVGDGETAELAYEYFTHDSNFEVVAFSVEQAIHQEGILFDLPVVAFENVERHLQPRTNTRCSLLYPTLT